MFETYTYLLDDVPRYVGHGSPGRAMSHFHMCHLDRATWYPDLLTALIQGQRLRIKIERFPTRKEAAAHEVELIRSYGRICSVRGAKGDPGGTLWNRARTGCGRTHGPVTRQRLGRAASAANSGRPKSAAQRDRLKLNWSLASEERMQAARDNGLRLALHQQQHEVTCPHCGKVGFAAGMNRWHMSNCRRRAE